MKTHYTKDYIENITGMTFEEFLNVVQEYSDAQNISFEAAKDRVFSEYVVEIGLNNSAANSALYDLIEPAAAADTTEDDAEAQQSLIDDDLAAEQPAAGFVEQVVDAHNVTSNHASTESGDPANSASFDRPMVDSSTLSQQLDVVVQSSTTLGATNLNYTSPTAPAQAIEATVNVAPIVVDIPNIDPDARYDIFLGDVNTPISGNVIADNGYGADSDADGSILNVMAGTFTTDQGGVVTLQENGDFTYTPTSGHSGVDTFSYSITDGDGATDTADVTFAITNGDTATTIDFSTANITGYGGSSQNRSDIHVVEDNGDTLQVAGNTWKDISLSYTVTADTVLEFDFMSTDRGEIHGIGFDTNDSISSGYTFKVYGTQNWGIRDFDDYAGNEGDWVHYSINVGDYYTGNFNRLFFVMDNDANTDSNSFFSNITIREPGTSGSDTVTGTSASQSLFGNDGDDVIYGLDGDDVLYGGSGIDFLYGGDGADTFVLDDSSDIDHVHDFDIAEDDKLDLSDLLSGYDPIADAIDDFVQITSDGTDTFVAVDADGGGDNFVDVAILHNTSGLGSENDLETSGNLITV